MATPAVGCRVRILKDYATVRYIGPVAQQQGTWVGVEWDDPSRGKHDGSTAGVRYFTCASGHPTAGSFVRIERVCFGVTVLEALRARYNNETAERGENVDAEELYVHTSRRRRVQVQMVGEEKIQQKQRQIHALTSARLVGLDVSAVGDPSLLRSSVPLLTSLDLTANLVAHWAFLEQLLAAGEAGQGQGEAQGEAEERAASEAGQGREAGAAELHGRAPEQAGPRPPPPQQQEREREQQQQREGGGGGGGGGGGSGGGGGGSGGGALPGLAVLNLSENRLTVPPPGRPLVPLPGLRVLVLNDCGLGWGDVLRVAPSLPSLEELHLCGNPITSLHPPPHLLPPPTPTPSPAPTPPPTAQTQPPPPPPPQPPIQQQQPQVEPQAGLVPEPQPQPQLQQTAEGRVPPDGSGGGGGGGEQAPEEEEEEGGEAAAELLASLFPRLQVLTLEDCQLLGWSPLELLRRLPALTRLHLADNPRITHIRYPQPTPTHTTHTHTAVAGAVAVAASAEAPAPPGPDAGSAAAAAAGSSSSPSPSPSPSPSSSSSSGLAAPPVSPAPAPVPAPALAPAGALVPLPAFPRLSAVLLGGCGVAEWGSVDQLDRFPELRELRLSGNPVLALSKTGGRFEVIARVSQLQLLNGADVRHRERRDSELRYLQHVAAEMEAAGSDESRRAAVRAAHPRLKGLMQLHGAVLATAARGDGGGGGSLASRMVELKLTCVAAGATAKMGTQVKKLPRSTTVSALRLLCERLFKVQSGSMALFLRAPGDPLPEDIGGEEMGDRTLGFFGVQDGSEVLIDEVADPEELRRAEAEERAAAAAAHQQRVAEQLRAAERMQAEFARSMGLQQQQQQQ
ncbi:hypothetical protein PLESTB_001293600 [Pleodorina starrii]|uniref:CAP-Gly domain-containing protein n=1 Tax=Pleodorina starrii TaxID=330485 RepID=A0A9W6BTN4_9CHLO|nr:hypothetical protein PLESTM_000955400 [Pleodorina starrii]GLC57953.1 hypothetical protein PLESTB_001293600 [Pleodorina starrii]GLC67047.1 hypothetical protein PLESTF_000509000 [Pleodorina starrii]